MDYTFVAIVRWLDDSRIIIANTFDCSLTLRAVLELAVDLGVESVQILYCLESILV